MRENWKWITLVVGMGILAMMLVVITFPARGQVAKASTIRAASCSQPDVQAAINAASDGDTVTVPGGECQWNSKIFLNNEIIVVGAGIDKTVIIDHGFEVADDTDNWRISGFSFRTSNSQITAIHAGAWKSSEGVRAFRIDNNEFDGYRYAIEIDGWSTGLIDHNQIRRGGIRCDGDDDAAWERDTNLGTDDFIFIEDNYFTNDNVNTFLHILIGSRGARFVFRYNTIEEIGTYIADAVDTHGYCHGPNDRGHRAFEIYRNTFIRAVDGCCRALFLRGGTGVVYENTFDEMEGRYVWQSIHAPIFLVEYRASRWGGTSETCPAECDPKQWCESDPCYDMIGRGKDQEDEPVYFWGNVDHQGNLVVPYVEPGSADFIELGEDYFLTHKPDYLPYPYPHPLTQAGSLLEGDVNGDDMVDIADIQACVGHILGAKDWGEAADVNEDGLVNILDVQRIVNLAYGE
jgi:hypothetical protein